MINGSRGTVTGVGDNRIDVELNGGRRVGIPHTYVEAGWLDHGYALTIHKAQGLTADETIVLADDGLAREHAYVALSRGRISNRLAVALADAFDDHPADATEVATPNEGLSSILGCSAAEDMAIDILVTPLTRRTPGRWCGVGLIRSSDRSWCPRRGRNYPVPGSV